MENNNQEEYIDILIGFIHDFFNYSQKLECLLDEAKDLLTKPIRSEQIADFIERVDNVACK